MLTSASSSSMMSVEHRPFDSVNFLVCCYCSVTNRTQDRLEKHEFQIFAVVSRGPPTCVDCAAARQTPPWSSKEREQIVHELEIDAVSRYNFFLRRDKARDPKTNILLQVWEANPTPPLAEIPPRNVSEPDFRLLPLEIYAGMFAASTEADRARHKQLSLMGFKGMAVEQSELGPRAKNFMMIASCSLKSIICQPLPSPAAAASADVGEPARKA